MHLRFKCECLWTVFFFFSSRRRHTRFKCDWSSDVCSSDLPGSLGGTVAAIGDQINNVSLLGGQSGTEYDFGKRLPASLSGNVADCLTNQPLSGVTVQLLDSNGHVINTTTTDGQGNYKFNGLAPDGTYGVSEILPPGFIHHDEDVSNAGGTIINDVIAQVALADGTGATG